MKLMNYELWVMNYDLWIMNYELWIMSYELWIMNYELWIINWACPEIPLIVISIRVFFLTVCFCVVSVGPIIRMGLCTLMHRKTMKNKAAFDMLFVKIRIKTHHFFLEGARHKRGFMHTNAPYLSRISQKIHCNFMMRNAH